MTGIIDYGMGNLHSVANALHYIGEDYILTDKTETLDSCERIILPGVGAFPDAMDRLKDIGLDYYLKNKLDGRPLIGICLGMQLLFDKSYEFGEHEGLGLIPGEVIKLTAAEKDRSYKIPHMGWNSLSIKQKANPLFAGIQEGSYVYFVHSFKCVPSDRADIAATSDYGEEICASAAKGNIFGMQFHPEKSGENVGLEILKAFSRLNKI